MEVHFCVFASIVGAVGQKTNELIESRLIAARIFVYILEMRRFFCSDIVDQARGAHGVDMLEPLLEGAPGFFKGFGLNN